MCSPVAGVGAGTSLAGIGLNAFGQAQGLDAATASLGRQQQQQAAYDAALRARTSQLVDQLGPGTVMPVADAGRTTSTMNTASRNAAQAVDRQRQRRTGGSRGGAEAQAVARQASGGTLAQAVQGNQLAALMQALQQGGQRIDLLGRQYAGDAGRIRQDAQRWAALSPLQQQAAGYHGQWARQIGSLFNPLGQGLMVAGMSQSATSGPGDPGATAGGWPSSTFIPQA